jgi:hypothetical protein
LDWRPIYKDLRASPYAKLLGEPGERRKFLVNSCPKSCIREHDITEHAAIAVGMKSFCASVQLQLVFTVGFRDRRSHFLDIRRADEGKPIQWLNVHAKPHQKTRTPS